MEECHWWFPQPTAASRAEAHEHRRDESFVLCRLGTELGWPGLEWTAECWTKKCAQKPYFTCALHTYALAYHCKTEHMCNLHQPQSCHRLFAVAPEKNKIKTTKPREPERRKQNKKPPRKTPEKENIRLWGPHPIASCFSSSYCNPRKKKTKTDNTTPQGAEISSPS